MTKNILRTALFALCSMVLLPTASQAGQYTNFAVAVYIPVGVIRNLDKPLTLSNQWNRISRQLKVDKVCIEVQRDRNVASDATLERVKNFFLDHGVRVAAGMAASDGSIGGQFRSFCYTDPSVCLPSEGYSGDRTARRCSNRGAGQRPATANRRSRPPPLRSARRG